MKSPILTFPLKKGEGINPMLKRLLTQYHPRYPRSLIYMLQASEYHTDDFLRWFVRVEDFRRVEKRKRLVKTPKALFLFALAWATLLMFYVNALAALWLGSSPRKYVAAILMLWAAPHLLPRMMVVLTGLGYLIIQKPLERRATARTRKILQRHPGTKIAIAGSFGKTTMREILRVVLSEGKKVGCPPHNHNTPIAIARFVETLAGDEEVLIFEIGEYYPGDVQKMCQVVGPHIGVITGINEAHFERFRSLESTTRTIFEIADFLDAKSLYINGESAQARKSSRLHNIVYSREGAEYWMVAHALTNLTGTTVELRNSKGENIRFLSGLLGLHQVGPLVAAADIASLLGMRAEQIKRGLSHTRPFEHRLNPVSTAGDVVTIDDSYNGNPDGVRVIIEFLASLKGRRRFYITPGLKEVGELTKPVHKTIGKLLADAGIEKVVLIKNSVTPFIAEGLKETGFRGDLIWFDDALAAFAALPHLTAKGDVVVLQNDWPDQYN